MAVGCAAVTLPLVAAAPPAVSAAGPELPVNGVTASGDDGHVAANAIDGDLNTRWSAEGDPVWIRFDLGAVTDLGSVELAWYSGDERRASFDVQVSDTTSGWTTVFSGQSSGSTTGLESYDFADSSGRYVQIVGHGNDDNEWNSISEAHILGPDDEEPPPTGTDPNGVAQIYPTKAGGAAPWTLGFGDWTDRFDTDDGDVSGSGKSTVVTADGQVRLNVMAIPGNDCDGDEDQGEALARGYMCTPDDWTNFEMTGYLKLDEPADDDGDQDWTIYGNGGRHTGDGPPDGCTGSAYKASYHYQDAEVRFGKESWHVKYDYRPWRSVSGGIDYTEESDLWLGMKFARYEFTRNGERGVRNELWLDLDGIDSSGNPANEWTLADVEEDHPDAGSWGDEATECDAPVDDQIMFWGGPEVTYRWDNTTSRLRLASVREIVPPANPPQP